MNKLTKAEILWTRKCPLRCSFCAMPNDTPRAPVEKMIQGLQRLKTLGCDFIAIYGASPLYDMEGLGDYIEAASHLDIYSTIITDGVVKEHKQRIQELYDKGLRSLTVSHDFVPYDKSSKSKSEKAIELGEWFMKKPDVRDVQITATVTAKNWQVILEQIPEINPEIWFSFDFIHFDRGNPGTKVRGEDPTLRLTTDMVQKFCRGLLDLKNKGFVIHQSTELLQHLIKYPHMMSSYGWKCNNWQFPSWLTIDADGTVMPCDDFYTSRKWKIWNLDEAAFVQFQKHYYEEVELKCAGCFWTTHFDASLIKQGKVSFDKYIHL